MKTHNPQNERIKRAYFTYLIEAKGFSEATLDGVAKALNRFETYTRFRDFKLFHIQQAKGFKACLAEQMSARTKDRLSKATLYATLSALKRFFSWLAGQPGYKSRISYSDAEYFNLSRQRRSWLGTVGISRHRASTASIGAAPVPSGLFSRTPSRLLACPISTRIASATPWRFSAAKSASRPSSTRRGPRTSATRMS